MERRRDREREVPAWVQPAVNLGVKLDKSLARRTVPHP